ADRKEAETLDVIRLRLQGPLGMLNGFWRAIDEALDDNNPRREEWVAFAVGPIFLFHPKGWIDSINDVAAGLNPLARARLSLVVAEINGVYENKEEFESRGTQMSEQREWLHEYEVFRNQLSNLCVRLGEFDSESAKIFSDRKKTPKLEPSWDSLLAEQERRFREMLNRNPKP